MAEGILLIFNDPFTAVVRAIHFYFILSSAEQDKNALISGWLYGLVSRFIQLMLDVVFVVGDSWKPSRSTSICGTVSTVVMYCLDI